MNRTIVDPCKMTVNSSRAQLFSRVIRNIALPLCLALCILGLSPIASAQGPRIITFDAPGADTKPGDFNGTYAMSINSWGAVAGAYQDTNNTFHGFLRSPRGAFTTFQAPGADTSPFNGTSPSTINDLGIIAGSYYDANGFSHGFLRSPDGKFTSFDVPGVGGFGTTPLAMNLEGAVVGFYTDANFNFHAFLRSPDGAFTTWDGPGTCQDGQPNGCFGSGASNINFLGIASGGYEDNSGNFVHHGLVRSPEGNLTTYDVPAAGTGSYQGTGCPGCKTGLNQWATIAGTYIDAKSVQHGYIRSRNGKFTTFDAPGAGTGSGQGTGCPSDCPTSINDQGQITGVYIDANFVLHGYLRSPEGKIVTVDPAGSVFTWSSGLNDFGTITGYYADANNVFHSFLRIPH
ncbi:MAG TPA: hypothetical protein VJ756_03940 [Terriglobales bacterium]|nr:hypothetical protein [Terriglobales bacterium]